LEIRNVPFPGQSRAGYRADSRSLGQPHADIVALGDSFTHALEVDQDSTWPSRLGALTGLQVANLGVTGYETTREVELFRRYGSKLQPKLILLLVSPGDPSKNMFFHSWRLAKSREDPSHPELRYGTYMFCRSTGISGSLCKSMAFAARSGILPNLAVQSLFLRWRAIPFTSPEGADAGRQITYQALDDLRSQASSRGARFCVLINDYWESLFPNSFAELTGFLREKRIPHLNLSLHTKYPRVKLKVALDRHWNEEGHALAAVDVHRFLRKNNLLPAKIVLNVPHDAGSIRPILRRSESLGAGRH